MFDLPEETLPLAFETIEFNEKLKPDYNINKNFQPYSKTEIADYEAVQGIINPNSNYLNTMNEGRILQLEEINQLINLCRFAYLVIKYTFLMPFIKVLIKLPPNKLFKMIFDLRSAPATKSDLNLNWINLIKWEFLLRKII